MESGYYSKQAVQDLLAVKDGTIDFLHTENQKLKDKLIILQKKVENLELLYSLTE